MENLFNNQIRASLIGDHFLYSWLEHLTAIEQKIDFLLKSKVFFLFPGQLILQLFRIKNFLTLNSQNFISNSPHFLPLFSCNSSVENLVFDQLMIPSFMFFSICNTCLLGIALIFFG